MQSKYPIYCITISGSTAAPGTTTLEKSGNKDSIDAQNVRNFPRLFAADEGQRRSLPWNDQEGRIISDHEVSSPLFLESFFSEKEERLQRRANEIDVDTSTESEFGSSTVDNTVPTPAQQRQRTLEIEEARQIETKKWQGRLAFAVIVCCVVNLPYFVALAYLLFWL